MNFGRQGAPAGQSPATPSRQPSRILVVEVCTPLWAHTHHQICEALESVFFLAGSLEGPPRIPLLSIYVAQSPPECLLPFAPVRGGFARLQRCLAELRSLPTEGSFQLKEGTVIQAVKDGLQQFKQFTRQSSAVASLNSSFVEITVLTSRVGTEMVKQLEAGLQGVDLVNLHQLQVVVIGRDLQPEPSDAEGMSNASGEASCMENSMLLGTAIDLQVVENDLLALETFFKCWLHAWGTDQEHLHLRFPPCAAGADPLHLKCDAQERLLNPALLPTAFHSSPASMHGATGPFWMVAGHSLAPRRLQVVRVLKTEGLCASVLFGIPLVVRPTSCWRLNWDELEANQRNFQALCHCLWKREWVLLARSEPQEMGPGWGPLAHSYQVLLPSDSASLLLQSVAVRELLLPCSFPLLPEGLPGEEVSRMESILEGLQLETAYNPLSVRSHLYEVLRSSLDCRPQAFRTPQHSEWHLPHQQASRRQQSKARAAVAPLRMASLPASPVPLALCSREEEEFVDSP